MEGIRSFFKKQRFWHGLLICSIFFILTAIATYPLVFHFSSHLPGFMDDEIINSWILWWVRYAVTILKVNPFFTTYQFFPHYIDISGDISVLYGAVSIVTAKCINYIAVYNLRVFASFIITGLTMYWWLYRITKKNKIAALTGSIVFTFSFFRLVRALTGHVDLASTEWYGLLLIFLTTAATQKKISPSTIVIGTIGSILMCYTDYRNTLLLVLYALIFSITYLLIAVFRKISLSQIRIYVVTVLVTLGISGLMCSPIILMQAQKIPLVKSNLKDGKGATIQSFVIRTQRNPYHLTQGDSDSIPVRISGSEITYLGIIACVACLISFFVLWKRRNLVDYIIFITTAICVLFVIGAWNYLYYILYPISIFQPFRAADRFIILVEIGIAYFVARGSMEVCRSFGETKRNWYVGGSIVVAMLLFFDSSIMPVRLIDVSPSPILERMNSTSGTVLEIPFGFHDVHHCMGVCNRDISFIHQVFYKRPIVGGYMSFIDDSIWTELKKDNAIHKLLYCQQYNVCIAMTEKEMLRLLTFYNIGTVVINKGYFNSAIHEYVKNQFALEKIAEDTDLIFYTILD